VGPSWLETRRRQRDSQTYEQPRDAYDVVDESANPGES